MKLLFISIALILQLWHAQGQNNFATCQRAWTKIGCFHDSLSPRPLPEMLLNDRDRYSKYHQPGYRLNWHKWHQSLHSLACRCAQKALTKGYRVFGLQFYGECWSGPFAEFNYTKDGKSDKCIMNLEKPTACVKGDPKECVGQPNTNYIYMLTANPVPQSPDIDGGFTEWSNWTACSKTCGVGQKTRERTCTNPKPKGNGKTCVGDNEEKTSCKVKNCPIDCTQRVDVAIVVDTSSSVSRRNFDIVKTFLNQLVSGLPVSYRMAHVSVIRYNHKSYLDWDFRSDNAQYLPDLKEAIRKLRYRGGGTRTDKAMEMAASKVFKSSGGSRSYVPHVLLVVTDGKTSPKSKPYSVVLKPLKDENVKIIAIGVGRHVDNNELKAIAMGKQENTLHVNNFSDLHNKINVILAKSCKKKVRVRPTYKFEYY